MTKLTAKQQRFVEEYLIDCNATKAAARAGYSQKTAHRIGAENMQKPAIKKAIADAQAQLSEVTNISAQRVIKEVARIALFDVRKLFDADGMPLPVNLLDDDTAAAIGGIKTVTIGNTESGLGEIREYKVTDKGQALEKLMKHLGLYEKDNEQKNQGLAESLTEAIARVKSGGR